MDPGRLDFGAIVATVERLSQRIDERFEGRGLSDVGRHLVEVAQTTQARVECLNRPRWFLRISATVAIVVATLVAILAAGAVDLGTSEIRTFPDWIMVMESAIQDLIFVGIAAVFLRGLEGRVRRKEALAALHELRSIAHVIDMHQLTKDPEALLTPSQRTASSPERSMTPFELTRYLDYCSEMLSITAKLAAMYAEESQDGVVLEAVREIQDLGSGLSAEVWQKMILLREFA